ncbi:diacylglycerol kinase [Sphingomonas ginkgonis]|uniref:Diacylglycerol kinase n=1 Tax=Sphingomonas ginkgonis TaxID=2315330 RepID=A0A3R9YKJ1_9SPHN|nr:diacylglycerol kinase family protein [Sphingomonas ginkgonis]RST31939.1 diacylglycerol kinase [Sphingomonas ginkgonis]
MEKARIALLSNPKSTGNLAQLPRVRAFCADHPDIFHYEVERADQIGEALRTIARVKPKMLVINGGDGTVQTALTEIHNGAHFGDSPPPVAVLPNGKTNLIALDLGAQGDPIEALERLLAFAHTDLSAHIVPRELIALRCGDGADARPVIGMFLGGAGLADTMLYCRDRIYPLGLPNGLSHVITALAVVMRQLLGLRASFLPPDPQPLNVRVRRDGQISGKFALLLVTTLDKLLFKSELGHSGQGTLKLIAVEERRGSVFRGLLASLLGKLGHAPVDGVHFERADEISIEGSNSNVILDGEMFSTAPGRPIHLTSATPLSFVKLAA